MKCVKYCIPWHTFTEQNPFPERKSHGQYLRDDIEKITKNKDYSELRTVLSTSCRMDMIGLAPHSNRVNTDLRQLLLFLYVLVYNIFLLYYFIDCFNIVTVATITTTAALQRWFIFDWKEKKIILLLLYHFFFFFDKRKGISIKLMTILFGLLSPPREIRVFLFYTCILRQFTVVTLLSKNLVSNTIS